MVFGARVLILDIGYLDPLGLLAETISLRVHLVLGMLYVCCDQHTAPLLDSPS